jgi:hypothetical protein
MTRTKLLWIAGAVLLALGLLSCCCVVIPAGFLANAYVQEKQQQQEHLAEKMARHFDKTIKGRWEENPEHYTAARTVINFHADDGAECSLLEFKSEADADRYVAAERRSGETPERRGRLVLTIYKGRERFLPAFNSY